MATDTRNIAFLNTTDTTFRTWVIAFKNALTAIGLVQTADTGQIDTATVLTPSAASQNRGNAVYTPNDGLSNYILVFGFGSGTSGALSPQIYLTICWATDGATNPIGTQQSSQLRIYPNNTNGGSTFDLLSCKSGSAISFSINESGAGTNANRAFLTVDRDRDQSTGNPQTTGVIFWCGGTIGVIAAGVNSITNTQRIPVDGGVGPLIVNNLPCIFPRTTGSWGRGSNIGIGAIIPWDGGMLPQTISCCAGGTFDFAIGTAVISVSMYGSAVNYRATGTNAGAQNTGSRALVIWQ